MLQRCYRGVTGRYRGVTGELLYPGEGSTYTLYKHTSDHMNHKNGLHIGLWAGPDLQCTVYTIQCIVHPYLKTFAIFKT